MKPPLFLLKSAILCAFVIFSTPICSATVPTEAQIKKMTASHKVEIEKAKKLFFSGKEKEAEIIFRKLSENNNPQALFYMGFISYRKNDLASAGQFYQRASQLGELNARYRLALLYMTKELPSPSPETAFSLMKSVADKSGYRDACYRTGIMYLSGTGCKSDTPQALEYLKKAADIPEYSDVKGHKEAQLLLGVHFITRKDFNNAYKYLELAADQGMCAAWEHLGDLYASGSGLEKPRLQWAKLCYLAAERISPDAKTEYNIGILSAQQGDVKETMRWMQLAASNGSVEAKNFIADKETLKKIKTSTAESSKNPLDSAISGFEKSTKKTFGVSGTEVLAQLAGVDKISGKEKMITVPLPEETKLKFWNFDPDSVSQELNKEMMEDREGFSRFMTDEFHKSPVQNNLTYPTPTIRKINYTYEKRLIEFLEKSPYQKCSQKETAEILKLLKEHDDEDERVTRQLWKIKDGLYFLNTCDGTGRWEMRYYRFIEYSGTKAAVISTCFSPPDAYDAANSHGIFLRNPAALNNMAVKMAEENSEYNLQDREIETILQELAVGGYAPGAYNLAIFYRNRNRLQDAEKYLKLAKELNNR